MHVTIWFSGPAWTGVNTAGLLLAELLATKGYSLRCDKEYASIIKGDNNCFFVSLSDKEQIQLSKKVDLFFAWDDLAITKNQKIYQLENSIPLKTVSAKYKNTFAFWACLQIVHISLSEGEDILRSSLKADQLADNFVDLQAGYTYAKQHFSDLCETINLSEKIGESRKLMMGNQLIGEGAIKAGMEFYSAYPMTPASGIIDTVVEHPEVTFFQGEDEIAVAMAMLWARYAGKRAMCGTSGGGFALMTESLAFAHQAEIGGVYVLGMRDGPSTGSPTFTSQGDLNFALHASFGETTPVVLAPSTFEEAYSMIGLAFNWADLYQHPVILLVDKQLMEGYKTIEEKDLVSPEINRGEVATPENTDTYLRYKNTENGLSPYAIPGQENTLFIATSYEHDEAGATNEDPKIKQQQMEKRFRKRLTFYTREYAKDFVAYEVINPQAENFFVTRGINRYNLEVLIEGKSDRGVMVIKTFHPFSAHLSGFFKDHQNQIKKLIFVEMNYNGLMEKLVISECGLIGAEREEKISHFRKYSLYPIFMEEIEELI